MCAKKLPRTANLTSFEFRGFLLLISFLLLIKNKFGCLICICYCLREGENSKSANFKKSGLLFIHEGQIWEGEVKA